MTVKVEDQDYNHVVINPGAEAIIDDDTKGFFICESEDEVKRYVQSSFRFAIKDRTISHENEFNILDYDLRTH